MEKGRYNINGDPFLHGPRPGTSNDMRWNGVCNPNLWISLTLITPTAMEPGTSTHPQPTIHVAGVQGF
jgi:hypothetical protein